MEERKSWKKELTSHELERKRRITGKIGWKKEMEERINKSRMKEEKKKNKFRKTEIAAGKNEPIKN